MGWNPIKPYTPRVTHGAAAHVTMRVSPGAGGRRRMVTLSVRLPHLPGIGEWFVPGAGMSVLFGTGRDAGSLRVEPIGDHLVRLPPDNGRKPGTVMIQFPPAGWSIPEGSLPPAICEYDYGDGWLSVTLPAWPARATGFAGTASAHLGATPTPAASEKPLAPPRAKHLPRVSSAFAGPVPATAPPRMSALAFAARGLAK